LAEFKAHFLLAFPAKVLNDHECLRFLRARKFDLDKAKLMFANYLTWRQAKNIDTILDNPPAIRAKVLPFLPFAHHQLSKAGEPIFWQRYGGINVAAMSAKGLTAEDIATAHAYDMELLRRRYYFLYSLACAHSGTPCVETNRVYFSHDRMDEASAALGRPCDKIFSLIDVSNISIKQLTGIHYCKAMIQIDQGIFTNCIYVSFRFCSLCCFCC
jgi:hypothetical protein